jgi:segregation and condensation protein B
MSEVDNKIKMIVEGLLLAAGKPLNLDVIAGVFSEDERPDKAELREVLNSIAEECSDRGFELKEVASGFRFQVKQDLSEWIAKLWEERPPRYTRALLETLALIAYRQPITRGDIEDIRGVGVSPNIIRTLLDREWVRIVGHKDVPGKPALFATTKQFLDYFNLKSIQELPPLSELKDLTQASDLFDVEDDLANRNVLELPDEEAQAAIDEDMLAGYDTDDLLEEDEAVALSKKPLDEILGIVEEVPEDDEEVEADSESEDDEPVPKTQEQSTDDLEQVEKKSALPASSTSIH